MVYTDDFDVTTPSGAEFKSQGDDRIREFKRALSQRLATAFTNWPDGDPLILNAGQLSERITIGYGAVLPNPPTDDFFFKTDVAQLYVVDAAGDDYEQANEFSESAVITVDLLASKPTPPTTPFFFATDTTTLYVKKASAGGGFEYVIAESTVEEASPIITNAAGVAMEALLVSKKFVANGGTRVWIITSAELPAGWRFNSASGVGGQYDVDRPRVGGFAIIDDKDTDVALNSGTHITNILFPIQVSNDGYVGDIHVFAEEQNGGFIPNLKEFVIELTLMRPIV